MANVSLLGADYPKVPAVQLPKTGGGTCRFDETAWFAAIQPEFLHDTQWSAALSDAANWSTLTPTNQAQNLTWKTTITTTANANATIERYGSGYGGEKLDFGKYNYIFLEDCYTRLEYTVDESTMGKYHVVNSAFSAVHMWGSRPRTSSGNIIYPSSSAYGAYASTFPIVLMCLYRGTDNVQVLTNNATYGVSLASIAPSMSSTNSRTPNYFNVKTPTIGIRGSASYMDLTAYPLLDADESKIYFRNRIYRVPVEFGLYTLLSDRAVDYILGAGFPTEPL